MSTPTARQQKIIEHVAGLSNEELLDEVLFQAQGDDWDGMFTEQGLWEYEYYQAELRKRLKSWLEGETP